jgi:hypothetical protein
VQFLAADAQYNEAIAIVEADRSAANKAAEPYP